MNRAILLDTNAYIYISLGDAKIRKIVLQANDVYLSSITLGELRFGYLKGSKSEKNERYLSDFLVQPQVHILSVDEGTSRFYASIKLNLRKAGKPIPENDLWIAAISVQHSLPLVTLDKHFTYVDGVKVIR